MCRALPATGGDSYRYPGRPRAVAQPPEGRRLYLVVLQCRNCAGVCGLPLLRARSRAWTSSPVAADRKPRRRDWRGSRWRAAGRGAVV